MKMKAISAVLFLLIAATVSFAQIDEARAAIQRGEFVRAVNILTTVLAEQPSADAYLYLGIAYRNMKEYEKAQELLREGARRYPDDGRFHSELANVFLEINDIEAARSELERTLGVDPDIATASDLLASIYLSKDEVQPASCTTTNGRRRNRGCTKRTYSQTSVSRLSRRRLPTTTMPSSARLPRR